MFVKVYKYKIDTRNLEKWKANNDAANKAYSVYGDQKWQRMIQQAGNSANVIELGFFESKEEFDLISKQADQDEAVKRLFSEFSTLLEGGIIEEEYDTI